ncbi:short-chain dehydrogenase [Aeromicrobium sp. Root236]|uniref:SDR family oxidoreductase n=1 Tax=Aeromicrobium sp. Root236 TaxID=1736498 RepID=UPI0006F38262|nr:SDR family oxidoreductase [Aeromicrobium sp. Root236]KRC66111.1 short-chain dehydrogenase [Aeromicrobium sp. Root236]
MNIAGTRVLIVGGTSGIGLAVARAVLERGATPIVVSRREHSVASALASLPGAEGGTCNLEDPDQVASLSHAYGPLDHLVFTAGEPLSLVPLADLSREIIQGFFATRFLGAIDVTRSVAPVLRAGGSITLTTGTASDRPGPGWLLGATVCGATDALTRTLALELAPLRVNAVSPGVIRSPLWSALDDDARQGFYDATSNALPVNRVGEVEDVALAYVYAMEQQHGTGTILRVDGGTVLV